MHDCTGFVTVNIHPSLIPRLIPRHLSPTEVSIHKAGEISLRMRLEATAEMPNKQTDRQTDLSLELEGILEPLIKLHLFTSDGVTESLSADAQSCSKHSRLKHHVNLKRQ